jgi:glycosyltransferase involved in cell wall biosynthesis
MCAEMDISGKRSVLIFCDLNSCGGVYIYTQQITRALIQGGASVYIISHEPHGTKEKEFLLPLMEGVSGYHLIPNQLTDQAIAKSIIAYAKEIEPAWYIPNYRGGAHAAMIPLKKLGIGNIFVCHNDHESQYRLAFRYQAVVDFFVCPSKKCKEILFKKLNESNRNRVKYIPHCVDILTVRSSQKTLGDKPVKLLYCGRIDFEQKKLNYLPPILKALKDNGVNAELNILGAGRAQSELEALFKQYDLDNVHFHGHVDRKELAKYFEENDIVILTSLYEGFCLALAEAMSCGLPAVAFECGGVIDDYLTDGENGYIVPFGNSQEFANKIQLLANDKEIYKSFSLCATKKIREEFSWGSFSEDYKLLVSTQSQLQYRWPLLRSICVPERKYSIAGMIDFVGKRLFGWG